MKRYFRNWKKIYQFAEFGDMQNFFIELAYATEKQALNLPQHQGLLQ